MKALVAMKFSVQILTTAEKLRYVIAVNTSTSPTSTSFTVPGLGGRKLRVFRDGRIVTPLGDLVVDKLPGLGVAVYVVPPPGW